MLAAAPDYLFHTKLKCMAVKNWFEQNKSGCESSATIGSKLDNRSTASSYQSSKAIEQQGQPVLSGVTAITD